MGSCVGMCTSSTTWCWVHGSSLMAVHHPDGGNTCFEWMRVCPRVWNPRADACVLYVVERTRVCLQFWNALSAHFAHLKTMGHKGLSVPSLATIG